MSEDIYATPDLDKKVRFQAGKNVTELEDRNEDICYDTDNVQIYDNCRAEGSTLPGLQRNPTEEEQQDISVSKEGHSAKKDYLGVAAVFLLLVCFILLTAVIILLVLLSQNISNLKAEKNRLSKDNGILISERHQLLMNYSEIKSLSANMSQRLTLLKNENDALKVINGNLTTERDELQNQTKKTCCRTDWKSFEDSCYLISSTTLNWDASKTRCEGYGAHLVIISSQKEEEFISSLPSVTAWIGLTDKQREDTWKWVDGTVVSKTYWKSNQPDDFQSGEDCATISTGVSESANWNDISCTRQYRFICEETRV